MYKIGVIGDKDSIMGFKAVGISVFPVSTPEKAQEVLKKYADDEYAIIYITGQMAEISSLPLNNTVKDDFLQ